MKDGLRCVRSAALVAVVAALLGATPAAAITITRGPFLQLLTGSSVSIVWRTDTSSACSMAIRPMGGTPVVIDGNTGTECVISVTGLVPGGRYGYVPRSNGSALIGESVFKVGNPAAPYTFIVVGDTGSGDGSQMAVRDRIAASPGTEFIVSTGDMIYEDGAAADFDPKFFTPYKDLIRQLVFWPCLGNHDVRTSSGGPWRDAFYTPANNASQTENYYSFDYGNAHVAVLNSNASTSPGSAQYNFLDQDLAASNATWNFVAFHHPVYSSSHHGSDTGIRADLVPLFDKHAVDIVFMGHDHDYERSKPMVNSQVVPDGSGTVYIVTGGGGRDLYDNGSSAWTAYSEAALHFTRVRVDGNTLTTEMVRSDGVVRDTMTLVKGATPPPPPPRCGDGVKQAGEACDNGANNSNTAPNACRTNCALPACGDGVVDTGEECERPNQGTCDATCHVQAGGCTNGGAAACDDGNPCTDDGCNLNTGKCTHTNNNAPCTDGNACTTGDACRNGACAAGTAVACDDGNSCTTDSCSPTSGCTKQQVPGCCNSAADCDDLNPCTIDSCGGPAGCFHDPISQAPAPRSAGNDLPACHGQSVPPVIDKLAQRATRMLARSAGQSNPNKSRHMSRRAGKLIKRALRIIDVATNRGRLSQECAAAVTAMLGEVQELPTCLTARVYPIADTYIEAGGEASWDHGKSDHMDVDTYPFGVTYLKFDLSKVGNLSKAELELYVTNQSSDGGRFYRILDSSWTEGGGNGVNKSSAGGAGLKWTDVDTNGDGVLDGSDTSPYVPKAEQMVGKLKTVSSGRSYKIDVTGAFKDGPGIYTLAIMNGSSNGVTFCSREHPSMDERPVLHVTRTDGGPPSTPAVCGDNVRTAPEACDGSADTACPGRCAADCTCTALPPPPPPPPPPGADGFSCLAQPGTMTTASGEYTKRYSNRSMPASTIIDARSGTFISSPSNFYPVNLGGGSSSCIAGGKVQGTYDRNLSWEDMHDMNNAGVRFENDNFLVDGVRVDNVEDGIRPIGRNFTIRQSWLSYIRDDCVENDHARGGVIEDSLFDGCYVILAERPTDNIIAGGADGRNDTVVMRNNLLRLEAQPKPRKGLYSDFGSGNLFKWADLSTKLELHDNIFMAEKLGQGGNASMGLPKTLTDCSNNVMVWLGPGNYPVALPSCFTVTKDRSVWDKAVAAWKANHPHVRP